MKGLCTLGFCGFAVLGFSFEYSVQVLDRIPGSISTSYVGIAIGGTLYGTLYFPINREEGFSLSNGYITRYNYPGTNSTYMVKYVNNVLHLGRTNDISYIYDNGNYSELRSFATNSSLGAYDMNAFGDFCGNTFIGPNGTGPYARIGGIEYNIQMPAGAMEGSLQGINDNGLGFGGYYYNLEGPTSMIWSPATGILEVSTLVSFVDVNDKDQVVGTLETADGYRAIIYEDGAIQYLGMGVASLINNKSEILIEDESNHQSYHWRNGVRRNLMDLIEPQYRRDAMFVQDMNDRGQILASVADIVNGQIGEGHTLLLTPVPEPATMAGLAAGALALARRRRK